MNTKPVLLALVLGFGAIGLTAPMTQAHAHAALKSSNPKNGATLTAAPKTLNLDFDHQTKLTKLRLTSGGKEIPVTVDPSAAAAKSFAVALPVLAPGTYQAKWATLGDDGHPMTGTVSFSVAAH